MYLVKIWSNYSKEPKRAYLIFIYNTKIFTSFDFRWTNRQEKICFNWESNPWPALVYMTSALTIDLSKHSLHTSFFFSEWYLIIESILRRQDVYDALGYSEAISNQVKMMVNSSPLIEGKYDYSKERKGVYVIFIYNTKICLPFTFCELADKKRHASTGSRIHDQDWFTWPVL